MSDIAATSPEPAYITKLALRHLPFSEVKETQDFFDGRYIKQRRLLILHLLRSTTTPILLQAQVRQRYYSNYSVRHRLIYGSTAGRKMCQLLSSIKAC